MFMTIPELFAPAFPRFRVCAEVSDVRVGVAVEEEGADRRGQF